MGIFSYFTSTRNNPVSSIVSTSTNKKLEEELYAPLSYNDCQNLYSYIPMAKRLINMPVKIAISKLNVEFGTDNEFIEEEGISDIDLDYIKSLTIDFCTKVRLYGYAILLPITSEEDNIEEPLYSKDIYGTDIRYNILDPLNTNVEIELDPSSYSYKRIKNIITSVGSHRKVNNKRVLALQNSLNNLYLQYNNAAYNYVGLSELQVNRPLLNLLSSCISSMERQLLYSSTLIIERDSATNVNTQALTSQADLLAEIKQNSVAILAGGLKLNQFQLANFDTITASIDKINDLSALASDIPLSIYTDESLSTGFSDNDNSASLVELYLSDVRNSLVTPTFKFILAHEIYNKVKDYKKATEIVDNIKISYDSIFNNKEIIKESEHLSDEVVEDAIKAEDNTIDDKEEEVKTPEVKEEIKEENINREDS